MIDFSNLMKSWDILGKVQDQVKTQEDELYKILKQNLKYYKITPIHQEPELVEDLEPIGTVRPEPAEEKKQMSFDEVVRAIFRILEQEREFYSSNGKLELTSFDGLIFIENRLTGKTETVQEYSELKTYLIDNPMLIEHELLSNKTVKYGKVISLHNIEEREFI